MNECLHSLVRAQNFGLRNLKIVAPGPFVAPGESLERHHQQSYHPLAGADVLSEECLDFAASARSVVESALVYPKVDASGDELESQVLVEYATGDCQAVLAMSARRRSSSRSESSSVQQVGRDTRCYCCFFTSIPIYFPEFSRLRGLLFSWLRAASTARCPQIPTRSWNRTEHANASRLPFCWAMRGLG